MEYKIPVGQWLILILCVFITTINMMFAKGTPVNKKSLHDNKIKYYPTSADYYEDKCDFILKKKFPSLAKVMIRVSMIFSEMMILVILIIQGLILATQQPNIMYWGFLIFSLTLQTAVVSASEENKSIISKCVLHSKILRLYSAMVLICQIGYLFITDKHFLAQYGFQDVFNSIVGSYSIYLPIMGFAPIDKARGVAFTFLSPVLFYITANIL